MGDGLAGALSGIGTVPEDLSVPVDEATFANPYTNIQVKIADHARGLYDAIQARVKRMTEWAEKVVNH